MTPATRFAPGDAVRILDGPFVNFTGVVRGVETDGQTVTVVVGVQGRDTLVVVDPFRLEKIA